MPAPETTIDIIRALRLFTRHAGDCPAAASRTPHEPEIDAARPCTCELGKILRRADNVHEICVAEARALDRHGGPQSDEKELARLRGFAHRVELRRLARSHG